MRVGIIGTGGIAKTHAKAIQAARQTLVAVTDVDRARASAFAEQWKCAAPASYAELLRLDLDLVVVGTPNRFHYEHCVQALDAGRAVLCEKPMTRSSADARKLVELSQKSNKPLFVGYMKRAHPVMQTYRDFAQRIGKMRSGTVRTYLPCGLEVWDKIAAALKANPDDCRYDDGLLGNVATHMLDLLLWSAGPVKRVIGARMQYFPGCGQMDAVVHALLEMQNGASIVLDGGFLPLTGIGRRENGREEFIELRGDKGLARVHTPWSDRSDTDAPVAEFWDEERKSWQGSTINGIDYYQKEFEYLALALKGETVPLASGEDGAAVDALVEAITRAGAAS